MPMSIHDEAFWDQVPAEFLRTLVEQGRDNGLPTSIFSMGDPHQLATPGIVCIKAGDGHNFPRHCHDCERFEIVLDGGFTDGTGRRYQAGDVMIAHHMDMYGPHIAEPGGYVVLEYFGSVLGTYELFWDTSRGPRKTNKIEEDHVATHGHDSPVDLPVVGKAATTVAERRTRRVVPIDPRPRVLEPRARPVPATTGRCLPAVRRDGLSAVRPRRPLRPGDAGRRRCSELRPATSCPATRTTATGSRSSSTAR